MKGGERLGRIKNLDSLRVSSCVPQDATSSGPRPPRYIRKLDSPERNQTQAAEWERLAGQASASWYLDPLVAAQKRRVHQELIRRWAGPHFAGRLLKTDVFEEAHGEDHILFDLFPDAEALGMDVSPESVRRALRRCTNPRCRFFAADVTRLPLRGGSVDLIVCPSTLDHFSSYQELRQAVTEIAHVLRPGGVAVITLDNAENPLYWLLRWASRHGWTPFRLGATLRLRELCGLLREVGLAVTDTGALIHNPRAVSTLLFLLLRRLLGRWADQPIQALLALFSWLHYLPTRRWTACFIAARAEKPPEGAVRIQATDAPVLSEGN
ncbi:MAG: class I SAM-dependent methyltransferase [Bryobacteraceae bacterium]|nr:class I SAM-dependent methyltransferase [Bryobacteraceae bacterium]